MSQYKQLLEIRLLPFTNSRMIEHIQEMDNSKVWAEFRNSWVNLNPFEIGSQRRVKSWFRSRWGNELLRDSLGISEDFCGIAY